MVGKKAALKNAALFVGIDTLWLPGFQELRYAESDCMKLKRVLCAGAYAFKDRDILIRTGSDPDTRNRPFKTNFQRNMMFAPFADQDLDLFVFFFGGHGMEHDGVSYLVPLDADKNDIARTGVPIPDLLELICSIPAQRRLLIFDICHGNGIQDGSAGLPPSFEEAAVNKRGLVIFSSCDIKELSHEDTKLKGGVFTHYFCRALGGVVRPHPGEDLTIFDVWTYAERKTIEWAKRNSIEQHPQFWAHSPTIVLTSGDTGTAKQVIPNFLNDPESRAEVIVHQLKKILERKEPPNPSDYCVRILARLSSFAIADREHWRGYSKGISKIHREERDRLTELVKRGACLKVIVSWNIDEFVRLPDMTIAKALARLKQLAKFVKQILGDNELLKRCLILRLPIRERNQMFLGDEYLFVGRHVTVGGGFEATEVITDPDDIEQEIEIYDQLFDSGVESERRARRIRPGKHRNRNLLQGLEADLEADIKELGKRARKAGTKIK